MRLLFIVFVCAMTEAHPQCLDYRAPFRPSGTLPICQNYQQFGCCSEEQARRISQQYNQLVTKSRRLSLEQKCDKFIEDLLCQTCSPYSAHLYDVEARQSQPKLIPGLCLSYCIELYASCSQLIPELTNNQFPLTKLIDQSQFCTYVGATDVDYCYPNLLTNSALTSPVSRAQVTQEGCLCLEEYPAGDLRTPLIFRHAGDGKHRVFIGDQFGYVFVYTSKGVRLEQPFLDLSGVVLTTENAGEERGLLGLAFHPGFKTNGRFYVHYSITVDDQEMVRVSEFLVDEDNENRADHDSERVILQVKQPYWNHNGGELLFGCDGYLYISLGDGGSAGDPRGYAQNKWSLLGKILRIDVDSRSGSKPYAIPADNPFNSSQGQPEIYAYGLRNVWRCGIDRGDENGQNRGRLICGDVGQSKYEEIDIIQNGGNYGWNAREGVACYKTDLCGSIGEEVFPIHSYDHSHGKSVVGGTVYRGCLNPNLQGLYFYGDHVNGRLSRLRETAGAWSDAAVQMCGNDVCMNGLVGSYPPNIMTFGEDEYGELYIVTASLYRNNNGKTGKVYRIVDPRRRGNPDTCVPARSTLIELRNSSTAEERRSPGQPASSSNSNGNNDNNNNNGNNVNNNNNGNSDNNNAQPNDNTSSAAIVTSQSLALVAMVTSIWLLIIIGRGNTATSL